MGPVSAPLDPPWEDVVEASVEFSVGGLVLAAFDDYAPIALPQPGWHSVRYSAVGMDAGNELVTPPPEGESAPDRYLLQLWPAAPAPDEVVVLGSTIAGYWHRVAHGEST